MVPMSILVTATSSLVYLQSRFVERPAERPVDEHQIFALAQQVRGGDRLDLRDGGRLRRARRLRDPADPRDGRLGRDRARLHLGHRLHALPRAPEGAPHADRRGAPLRGRGVRAARGRAAGATWRWRWPLVLGALALSAPARSRSSALPGVATPMPIHTDPVEYLDPHSTLYKDIRRFAPHDAGPRRHALLAARAGRKRRRARGADRAPPLPAGVEADPEVGAAVGPTSILRLVRYLGGAGDGWPADPEGQEEMAATLEAHPAGRADDRALRAAPRARRDADHGDLARRGARGVRAPRRRAPPALGRGGRARARARAVRGAPGRPGAAPGARRAGARADARRELRRSPSRSSSPRSCSSSAAAARGSSR